MNKKKNPGKGVVGYVKGAYSKPQLKKKIDAAMEAFLQSGKEIERWVTA